MDDLLLISISIYLVLISLIAVSKPLLIYDSNKGRLRSFGSKKNKTILPFQSLCILIAAITFICVLMYRILMNVIDKQ